MRRNLGDLRISEPKRQAVLEADRRLKELFPVERLIVFGSAARGQADEGSDLDVMVITREPATHRMRNAMSDVIFEINLEYDTNLSIIVVDAKSWDAGILTQTPLHAEVERDGVPV